MTNWGGKWELALTLSLLEKFLHGPLTVFKSKVLQPFGGHTSSIRLIN